MTAKFTKTLDEAEAAVSDAAERVAGTAESARDKLAGAAESVAETSAETAEAARGRMGDMIRKAKDGAEGAKDAVVASAGAGLSSLRDTAIERADDARELLSDAGDRLAATLERAAEGEDADAIRSRVYTSVARGVTSASDMLRQRSVTDLTADLRDLARRHPGAFMAAAAVAGFCAARFIRSSSRHAGTEGHQKEYRS
ncbi:MAG: hypothetical protein V9G18_01100 [Albidovulum sp.]